MLSKVKNRPFARPLPFVAVAVVVLCGLLTLYYTDHLPFFHRQKAFTPSVSGSSETKGEPSKSSQPPQPSSTNNQPSSSDQSTQNKGDTSPNPGTLLTPSGTFVSNHRPHLSDNPSGSGYLTSSCTTTPGATCKIMFTLGSTTKSLPPETTDAGGSAYWNNWRPQDYGITEGSWSVQAVATQNGTTKTADDALSLTVSQ